MIRTRTCAAARSTTTSRASARSSSRERRSETETSSGRATSTPRTAPNLTELVATRFGIARILDGYGTGTALFVRGSAAAGGGTIWEGTRIILAAGAGAAAARQYAVLEDTPVGQAVTSLPVPIRATTVGVGAAVTGAGGYARLDDPLWDPSWQVQSLTCTDGTVFEKAAPFRARVRQARLDARLGYVTAITNACVAQGATYVALFASNYGGDATDFGLNACYVAEAGYSTSTRLIRACTVALEGYRVCGADLQVLGMMPVALKLAANVVLWDDPGSFSTVTLDVTLRAALSASFDSVSGGYSYSLDTLRGVMLQASDAVQDVVITSPSDGAPLLVRSPPNFPGALSRYSLAESDIALTFVPPS